ncbi:amino acid transporter [Caerostris extrusa]|uniref:Amino acid transporter n=1 Tax=Caerostris extrusa TaxID=172846 RepID=A0AAV4UJH3_CAEEX|nr:amino acid transporter [Caerostris extrusa]
MANENKMSGVSVKFNNIMANERKMSGASGKFNNIMANERKMSGVSSLRKGGDARMVAITIGFFLFLSTLSAIMGASAGHLIHPGRKITSANIQPQSAMSGRRGVILDSMLDLLWNAVPGNIIEATFQKEYTHVEILNSTESQNSSSQSPSIVYKKSIQTKPGVNFMGGYASLRKRILYYF